MWQLIILAALTALERYAPARRDPVQPLLNVTALIATLAVQMAISPSIALAISHATARLALPSLHVATWPLLFGAAAYVVVMDLGEYLFHRAQHAIPVLWRMHSLHHSDPCMSALTAARHFWGDVLVKGVTIWPAAAILTGPNTAIVGVYALISLYHTFTHANLPVNFGRFSWVLNSPAYHRIHHSREQQDHDANFAALFPIFDVVLGSYRRPQHSPATGLAAQPRTPLEVLTWPVNAANR
jgi:sterol desaturase/sphingolipid hydroxylase (fatty acid hydroxylase superfamily)